MYLKGFIRGISWLYPGLCGQLLVAVQSTNAQVVNTMHTFRTPKPMHFKVLSSCLKVGNLECPECLYPYTAELEKGDVRTQSRARQLEFRRNQPGRTLQLPAYVFPLHSIHTPCPFSPLMLPLPNQASTVSLVSSNAFVVTSNCPNTKRSSSSYEFHTTSALRPCSSVQPLLQNTLRQRHHPVVTSLG